MSIFSIFILIFIIKKLKSDVRFSDFGKGIFSLVFFGIVVSAIAGIVPIIPVLLTLLGILGFIAVPLGVILFLIYKYCIKQESNQHKEKYGWDEETTRQMNTREKTQKHEYENPAPLTSKILPKPVRKRKKLVAGFSEKYDLKLTEEQIRRISDASYFSFSWKQELEAMAQKYDAVYQWFQGNTAYLRAYLYVFPVQDVTSDFTQQQQICIQSFEEVFAYADSFPHLNIDEKIEKVNSKFFTNFNEITYMIAFRFLEANGYHHSLDKVELHRNDDDIDDLLMKYQKLDEKGTTSV